MNSSLIKRAVGIGITILALAPMAARADRAIVVGVNHYPNVDHNDLGGSVNDARNMEDALKKYGFEVTLLTDADATRDGILSALRDAQASSRPDERFVFYFAGHGTHASNGGAVLLPSDASDREESADLRQDDLYQEIAKIQCRSRSVVLDSCFSGGMMRSFKGLGTLHGPHFRSRYLVRNLNGAPHEKKLVVVNHQDNHVTPAGSGICYFTAARDNEQAGEDDFGGETHGVFTHFLVEHLNGARTCWGDLHRDVEGEVRTFMSNGQHPMISPSFVDKIVFDVNDDPNPTPPNSIWDLYNEDHADSSQVDLTMMPDKGRVKVNEELRLSVKTGSEGYLIILEQATDGSINLAYPMDRNVESSHVQAAASVGIPDADHAFACDAPGREHIKAILFSQRDAAQSVLDAVPVTRSVNGMARLRNLHVKPIARKEFYTSDITFEAVTGDQTDD